VADPTSSMKHMLPRAPEDFASKMEELGIKETDHVVVYHNDSLGSACRVYWMFKVYGHEKVSLLDGGLWKWTHEGHSVDSGPVSIPVRI
jgi:thiosulfate/3-mercaptopyruvate sulfurtransferase